MKNEAVKNRTLIEKFGKYVDHRKNAEKKSESFTETLSNRSVEGEGKGARRHGEPRSARRNQPPQVGRAKNITQLQAGRIAHLAPVIEHCARKYNVPVELICGVILQESGGNAKAVSSAGARGLMQLMPGTARRFGVANSFDPVQNIEGGTKYLRFLLDRFKGDISLALAGYNAGEGNVEKYGNKIPPFKETQNYVPNVLGYTQTMIDIFFARLSREELPPNSRRV